MRKPIYPYHKHQHSCFLLQYHLVLVTKYRHPVLDDDISEFLLNYTKTYFKERNIRLLEINTNKDHIHILFEGTPTICLSQLINAYKSASARHIRQAYGDKLNQYYWKPYFWSNSYFISTVSDVTETIVSEYIKNQKE